MTQATTELTPKPGKMSLQEIERDLDAGLLRAKSNGWRLRRNGKTQTWKTRPGHFRIPVKLGFRGYAEITHYNDFDIRDDGIFVS